MKEKQREIHNLLPNNTKGEITEKKLRDAFDIVYTMVDANLQSIQNLQQTVEDSTPKTHTHRIADVSGLQTALDSKASATHTHTIANISNLQTALDGKASATHTHTIANISNLQSALDSKASATHTHTIANISNLQTALDGKASATHTHTIANISNLQTALDGKASATHTHTIANISNLQTALDSKASATHTHTIANISNLQTALDRKVTAVTGKNLSTNDFTNELKDKLIGLENVDLRGIENSIADINNNLDNKLSLNGGTIKGIIVFDQKDRNKPLFVLNTQGLTAVPVAGGFETDGTSLYYTNSRSIRKKLSFDGESGDLSFYHGSGREYVFAQVISTTSHTTPHTPISKPFNINVRKSPVVNIDVFARYVYHYLSANIPNSLSLRIYLKIVGNRYKFGENKGDTNYTEDSSRILLGLINIFSNGLNSPLKNELFHMFNSLVFETTPRGWTTFCYRPLNVDFYSSMYREDKKDLNSRVLIDTVTKQEVDINTNSDIQFILECNTVWSYRSNYTGSRRTEFQSFFPLIHVRNI
ncbi:hypothetical protein AB4865_07480 [Capnocytophaga sp. ARDL2]|uniref:hypothetical protein n=1 Tax=Capnocytophaga sp. ARDL2 TaxID=3238809 RepID=UPI003557B89F